MPEALVRAFGADAVACRGHADDSVGWAAKIAIGDFSPGDVAGLQAFLLGAGPGQAPSLPLVRTAVEARLGPLTLHGRVGCGECGRRRLTAAAVARRLPDDVEGPAAFAASSLVAQVATILRDGAAGSPLLDHVLVVAFDGSESFHRLIPLSHCPVCGGAATADLPRSNAALSADDPPEALLAALDGWIEPRTGLISAMVVDNDGADGLPVVVTAVPPRVVDDDGTVRPMPVGWGKGLSMSAALLSAVGETIERYAAALPDPERLTWARPDELAGDVLDPRTMPLYTDAQYARVGFPFVRFDSGVRHPWVRGRWLHDGVPVWAPALLAFLAIDLYPENVFCQGTSNGLAASTDIDDAAHRAVMELVERDALLVAWRTGTPATPVLPDAVAPEVRDVVSGLERLGATVELYVLPTAAVGTAALCLALGDGVRWPGAVIGLAADLDPHIAMKQAVLEAGQTGPHLCRLMQWGWTSVPDRPEAVTEMLDHAAFYFPAERAGAFDRIRSAEDPIADLTAMRDPRTPVAAGLRIAVFDVTSADVAIGPFRVMRAISPDLQPLTYGYGLDRLLVERVGNTPRDAAPVHPVW